MKATSLFILSVLLGAVSVHAQDTSQSGSSSTSSAKTNATQANGQTTSINQTYQGTDISRHTSETVLANPGAGLGGTTMSYSNFNCANGATAALSTMIGSIGIGGARESTACNFRADAALDAQASVSATEHGQPSTGVSLLINAQNNAHMADFAACTNAPKRILNACIALGLVADQNTPVRINETTWQACHLNAEILDMCIRDGKVTAHDEPATGK